MLKAITVNGQDSQVTFRRNAQDPPYLKNLHYFYPGNPVCPGLFPDCRDEWQAKKRTKEQASPNKLRHYSPVVINLQPSWGNIVNI
jgi:hypothetical protein